MSAATLERHQLAIYLLATVLGLQAGTLWPAAAPVLQAALWPALALLLLVTFVQVPLLHVRDALRDLRFTAAVLLGNFVLLPLLAWGLVALFGLEGPLRLGVLLVLLVPCTDWFIAFAQLGKGDGARAVAVTPLNLVLQLVLLPLYLWYMADAQALGAWQGGTLAAAALTVLAPLLVAAAAEPWLERHPAGLRVRAAATWWPVPLLALVVFLVAGAQVGAVRDSLAALGHIVPVFVLFLVAAALLAKAMARALRLPTPQGRTLAFSLGTRNAFIVLPLALALPPGWELAAVAIVAQSLVELVGMAVYVWAVPRHLFRH